MSTTFTCSSIASVPRVTCTVETSMKVGAFSVGVAHGVVKRTLISIYKAPRLYISPISVQFGIINIKGIGYKLLGLKHSYQHTRVHKLHLQQK